MSTTIVQDHSANLDTLSDAFAAGQVCLMDCIERSTGEHVAVICAIVQDPITKEFSFTPFARFFNGNPYDILIPPGDPEYEG